MLGDNCPFCSIVDISHPSITSIFDPCQSSLPPEDTQLPNNVFLSTSEVVGFLDIQPLITSAAHILIIPRNHHQTLDSLADDRSSSMALGLALPLVAKALRLTVQTTDYNVIQNNGVGAGQVVDHVHFHIVARKKWDTLQTSPSTASNGAVVQEPLYDLESDKTRYISESMSSSENGVSQKRTGNDNLLDNPKFRFSYAAQVFGKGKRHDLDEDWATMFVEKLRKNVYSLLEKRYFEKGKM